MKFFVLTFLIFAVCAKAATFEFFLFTTFWPGNNCLDPKSCYIPKNVTNSGFTIHGLWTENNDGTYPSFCTNEPFDVRQVEKILPQMVSMWPSTLNGNNSAFWDHEWTKHGTCAGMTQFQFFDNVLSIFESVNLYQALADAGITASYTKQYSADVVTAAMAKHLGVKPILQCSTTMNKYVLAEVWMCVDKQKLVLTDCTSQFYSFETNLNGFCRGSFTIPPYPGGTY